MSVVGLVESIAAVDLSVADQRVVSAVLGDARRVRGWLDSIEVAAARRLTELAAESPSMFPERVVSEAGRVTLTEASRGFDRAQTTATIPQLGTALGSGDTSGGHVDVVTRALRPLTSEQRGRLAERGDLLALAASQLPRDEFARTVRAEVRRIEADDGIDRLQRQRRATSLRTWVDRDTGMWCLKGEFDPETGALLDGRLRSTVQALFHDRQPDTCPTDPLLKQHHLRALALVELSTGQRIIRADRHLRSDRRRHTAARRASRQRDRLRTAHRVAHRHAAPVGMHGRHHPDHRRRRRRLVVPRPHLAHRQPGPTPRSASDVSPLRHPGLPSRVRQLRHPPPPMVSTPRQNRHRQPPAVVQQTPSLRPRRRLEARPRRAPKPHHHIPRRSHHDHRATLGMGPTESRAEVGVRRPWRS